MNRQSRRFGLALLAALLLSGALSAQGRGAQRGGTDSLSPDYYLREYDPVTLTLAQPEGPAGGGPADDASGILSIQPRHPGEYRWIDERTLRFLPAEPWPPLRTFAFKSPKGRWTLETLMSPPSSISPDPGSTNLASIAQIDFSFPVPLATERLMEMISFELRPLPGLESQDARVLGKRDFSLKEIERAGAKDRARYRLVLDEPLGEGVAVTMRFKLSLDGRAPGSVASYSFRTRPEFRVQAFGSGSSSFPVSSSGSSYPEDQALDRGTSPGPLFIEFSENVEGSPSIELLKRMIKVNPAPRKTAFSVSGRRVYVSMETDPDKPYRLTVSHSALKSSSGRALAAFGPSSFSFFHKSLAPFLNWDAGQAILERHGPRSFPMRGRGGGQGDRRRYRIDPPSRNFWPFPDGGVVLNEAAPPPMPGEEPSYGEALDRQIRLLGSPEFSDVVELPLAGKGGAAAFGLDLAPALRKMGDEGKAGTYLVGYRVLGSGTERSYVRVQVTDLSLTAVEEENAIVFHVTSLSTAKPVADARVLLERRAWNEKKGVYEDLAVADGRTDKEGRFRYAHAKRQDGGPSRIVVSTKDDSLVIDPERAPPYFHNDHWFGAQSAWLSWLASDPVREQEKPRRRAYLFTERPMYRAEEPVHIQGFVRLREAGLIKADDAKRARDIVVRGPGDAEWRYPVETKGNGYVYHLFSEKDLPSGDYTAELRDNLTGESLASVSFKKEAYRVPSFEVNLSGPDVVPFDAPFQVLLAASYYAGGKVVGQSVEWDVTENSYAISPAAYPGYDFSSYARTSGSYGGEGSSNSEREDVTDDSGSARITIDPRTAQSIQARSYRIQASVRGADRQTVTGTKTVRALPPFSIGLKLRRFETEKVSVRPSLIVLDHLEKPLPGKKLSIKIYERQWHSYLSETDIATGDAKYVSDVVDQLVLEKEAVSADKPVDLDFPVKNSGVYVVEVQGRDEQGRLQSVRGDLFVSGPTPVAWKRTQAAVFETTLDKDAYVPGDAAKLLLQSPFQDCRALVIVERPEGNEYRWVDVANGQAVVAVEVRENQTPRFPVHAVLMRGRIGQGGFSGGQDRARPLSVANTTWIAVDPAANRLTVELVHEAVALPGSPFKILVRVKDWKGRPVNGEAALWLVDRAVLALAPERFRSPLDSFIDPVTGRIRVSDTRNLTVGNLPFDEAPGGDWAESERAFSLLDKTTVRKNFKTVPYYESALRIVNGVGEASFDLPDNLTEFAVRAIATSGFDKFGTAKSLLAVRLPVVVQESMPRFVRPGDEMNSGGIARIVEGKGGEGRAEATAEGLLFMPSLKPSIKSDIVFPEKEALRLDFRMRAPSDLAGESERTVSFTLGAQRLSDGASDAFKLTLPVKQDGIMQRIESTIAPPARKEISFPATDGRARPGTITQTLYVSSAPELVRVLSALRFQLAYEYGCTEQRVSKVYPSVALAAALGEAGLPPEFNAKAGQVKAVIDYLGKAMDSEGLYAFYPGDRGRVYLTAYVVEFLSLIRKTGVSFDPVLIDKPVRALKAALRSDYDRFTSGRDYMERVRALIALDAAGQFDSAYAKELLAAADGADLTTRADIYRALRDKRGLPMGDLKRLKKSLDDAIVFKRQGGQLVYSGLQDRREWNGDPFLYSQPGATASVWAALAAEKADSPEAKALYKALMDMAGEDGWGDSYTNSRVLSALAQTIAASKAMKPAPVEYDAGKGWTKLDMKGRPFGSLSVKADRQLKARLLSQDDKSPTTLVMAAEFAPMKPGSELKSQNSGFAVERELIDCGDGKRTGERKAVKVGATVVFKEGTVVEDHVRVVNGVERSFVAVRVPLPSGFEPMNPSLATSPAEAAPAGRITLQPAYADYEDDQVTFYYNVLPRGTYDFYFRARANFEGAFIVPPAKAQALYDSKVFGYSDGVKAVVLPLD